ncbi:TPA: hypothetical protein ACO9FU_005546, partial [Klebsiella pneumoniae]
KVIFIFYFLKNIREMRSNYLTLIINHLLPRSPPWIESAGSMLFLAGILYSKLSNQAGQHAQRIYARRSLC